MKNENNKLVVAYFVNASAAEAAAEDLKKWDKANDAIKLGAIAILAIDPQTGELEASEVGASKRRSGSLWGTAIGAAVGILTAGIGLIPGLLLGAGGGAALGSMMHKDVGMTNEEHARMIERLRHGGAALAVMADDFEIEATSAELTKIGGVVEHFEVPSETATAITTAADAQSAAASSVDEAAANIATAVNDTGDAVRSAVVDLPGLSAETSAAVSALAAVTQLDPADAAKLHEAGIDKASKLLATGTTPKGREQLASASGLPSEVILAASKKLDLMRIKGVGTHYAALLMAAGIETVPDMARRNAANLYAVLVETNADQEIVKELPGEHAVELWVAQAKALPRMITY